MSDLPISTPTFYGRGAQLEEIYSALDPSKSGRKGILLFGIGGSGKTQLALQYIKKQKQLYKAVMWINAFTSEQITESFTDAFCLISKSWPAKDLPNPYTGENKLAFVLSRLRSTLYRNWLLVIDSADDLDNHNLVQLIPDSSHGSIIVTSTRRDASDVLEQHGFSSIEIDKLDDHSGKELLLGRAGMPSSSQNSTRATAIVKELNGLPLALEQAGILLRRKVVNLDNFIEEYHVQYNTLMEHTPKAGEVQHDKTRSMYTILSMLYSFVKHQSRTAAAILRLLAIIGPTQVPISILLGISRFNSPVLNADPEFRSLQDSSNADSMFRLRLNLLEDMCLIKRRPVSEKSPELVSLHRAICQWVVKAPTERKDEWILFTALGLGSVLCEGDVNLDWPMCGANPDSYLSRICLSWVDRIDSLIQATVDSTSLQAPGGPYATEFANIAYYFGCIYFCNSRYKEAMTFLSHTLAYTPFQPASEGLIMYSTLQLYYCLGICYYKMGDFDLAENFLREASNIPPRNESDTSIIRRKLKEVLRRGRIHQEHYETAVNAAHGPKFSSAIQDNMSQHSDTMNDETGGKYLT
ncbi:P-loop containing nucleoside triphosphate hydrolase protein [Hypoxylon sp. FL1857]|nr:P-loop containing nucleoside triphosphate hydrolase protein [Hypoxylon sp. FL1857]